MSKILRAIGKVASIVATVSAVVLGPTNPVTLIASLVAVTANVGAQLLQKRPPARGSITQVTVGADPPQPYLVGESYYGGVVRHDTGYGAPLKKVPNPYRWMPVVYSGCGPVEALVEAQADFTAIGSYYSGFLAYDSQLGATPETSALVPPLSAPAPGWDADSKLSGQAAIGWNFKFDKDGKVFASGLPVLGAIWKGVKVYDPRLDSTYPGGSGAHRIDDESTWAWSDNPALHALAYAYGRRQNGVLVMGVGLPVEAIRVADFVTLANVCEANGWRLSGVLFEPGDRWANLKELLRAGAAEPISAGGLLSLRVRQPQVALATLTDDDLIGPAKVTPMQTFRDRLNIVVPKRRSPEHNWELVADAAVSVPEYIAEDGEEMLEEIEWPLVRDADQAAQLARYRLEDGREYPIELVVGPGWRWLRPGDCVDVAVAALGVDTPAVILSRRIDPGTLEVSLTLISETSGKHAYALGTTGTPPPTPALGQTGEERDAVAAGASGADLGAHRIKGQDIIPLSSTDTTISVAAFDAVIDDGRSIGFPADTSGTLSDDTDYDVFYDLVGGGYLYEPHLATAQFTDSTLVFLGGQRTALTGGGYTPYDPPPDGYGGGGGWSPYAIP